MKKNINTMKMNMNTMKMNMNTMKMNMKNIKRAKMKYMCTILIWAITMMKYMAV